MFLHKASVSFACQFCDHVCFLVYSVQWMLKMSNTDSLNISQLQLLLKDLLCSVHLQGLNKGMFQKQPQVDLHPM